jgi:hypothetical protein
MNDWLKRIGIVLVVFPLGLLVGAQALMVYESNAFKPWGWAPNNTPIIVNCYGPEMDIGYIQDAVDFWKPYGEDVAFIIEEPIEEVCKHEMLDGFILLKKVRPNYHPDSSTLASTARRVQLMQIRGAVIRFNPGSYRLENVFEHELGHAYGYTHMEIEGHVMHPEFESMGPRFWIPD